MGKAIIEPRSDSNADSNAWRTVADADGLERTLSRTIRYAIGRLWTLTAYLPQTQNLLRGNPRAGSSPAFGTKVRI